MTPKRFIDSISTIQLQSVFNPYIDRCSVYDRHDAPVVRRRNLLSSIQAAIDLRVQSIWIARDLGYRGGRRTGLPLTDELHLDNYHQLLGGVQVSRATTGPPVGERTAGIIWNAIALVKRPLFMWNVFPLHPYEPGNEFSNRCHTKKERKACAHLLVGLLELLAPTDIIAVGRDAAVALKSNGIRCHTVRHPSFGGQKKFLQGISDVYRLPRPAQSELPFGE